MGTKHLIPLGLTIVVVLSLVACKSSKVAESNKADAANAKTEIKGPKPATATAVAATTETGKIKTEETSYTKSGQNETVIYFKGLKIHPDRFTIHGNEPLNDSVDAYKCYNNEYFVLTTIGEDKNKKGVELFDKDGKTKLAFNLKNADYYYLQNCYISNDGSLLHFLFMTLNPATGYMLQTYSNGNLIFQTDSLTTYLFNKDNNILTYLNQNKPEVLYFFNFAKNISWNKSLGKKLDALGYISIDGENLFVNSDNEFYALNGNKLLWNKEINFFNGNMNFSDFGKSILVQSSNEVKIYSFNDLSLVWSKNNSDLVGMGNSIAYINYLDSKDLILISTHNSILVFNQAGQLLKTYPIQTEHFFEVYEIDDQLDIIVDGKTHHKIKLQELTK